ncbi:hypothetical protein [Oerskovia flava]|uniref:hypothetical protein n=1 Tax=Oerskovia flava TaxID=2986422 RepID=UPI00224087BD|nr:hypothetical protein [Oerskovia sp. JB1-3-2]
MTTRRTITKTAGALAAGALALSLSACGGDSIEAFCNTGSEFETAFDDLNPEDPDAVAAAFGDLADEMEAVDAPSEISGDWDVLTGVIDSFASTFDDLSGIDPTDPEYAERMMGVMDEFQADEVQTAGENVQAFTEENCTA